MVKRSILTASVLYYCYIFTEKLPVLRLVDALLLRRARGNLDLETEAAQRLESYKQRRRERGEIDGHLFRCAFNLGDADVPAGTTINECYPRLWRTLLVEVADYIRRDEDSNIEDKVSRARIDEAVRELQYNLSDYVSDMELDAQHMYAQIEDAMNTIGQDDIFSGLGLVRRRDVFTAMETLAAEENSISVNAKACRDMAVEGFKILRYIAFFDPGTTSDEDFRSFVRSCEKWIIAAAEGIEAITNDE